MAIVIRGWSMSPLKITKITLPALRVNLTILVHVSKLVMLLGVLETPTNDWPLERV